MNTLNFKKSNNIYNTNNFNKKPAINNIFKMNTLNYKKKIIFIT
jgi:hypothetical protein